MCRPNNNEIEISLFGPGYGEAIAVHIGNEKWILIDSCINNKTQYPVSLEYLNNLGIDVERSVIMITATHWHDDHIKGLSQIYNTCNNANFVFSAALKDSDYKKLFSIYERNKPSIEGSGVDEFTEIFNKLILKRNHFSFADQDKLLFRDNFIIDSVTYPVLIWSLSPTNEAILQSVFSINNLIKLSGQKKRVPPPSPNYAAVVLLICIGNDCILLGADLESNNKKFGWDNIINNSTVLQSHKKSIFIYKVAHHGSESSDHSHIWDILLKENPYSMVTPFINGCNFIPSIKDIERLNSLTANAYITNSIKHKKQFKWTEKAVSELFHKATIDSIDIDNGFGSISLKKIIGAHDNDWSIKLNGSACHLNQCL